MSQAESVHFDSDYLTIQYDADIDAVVMDWHDFTKGEQFRDGLDRGLDLVKSENSRNWLADLRDLGAVDQDDQEWSNEDWFPRAIQAGLENMAIVKPESAIAEMSVDNIMQEVEGTDLVTHHFDDREQAREWLQSR